MEYTIIYYLNNKEVARRKTVLFDPPANREKALEVLGDSTILFDEYSTLYLDPED